VNSNGIARSQLPFAVRSPGKCILFGEHAVVYGRPELLLAIDLYTQIGFAPGTRTELNRDPDAAVQQPYLRTALARLSVSTPLSLTVVSRVPKAAGLGSSAAFTSALAAGLSALGSDLSRPELAQRAFDIERSAQGVGSPGDTTASVAGGYVALNDGGVSDLWTVSSSDQSWAARTVVDPRWAWVVGYSGVPRDTATAVRAVGERLKQSDGPDLLASLEAVARRGIRAVEEGDRPAVGAALRDNHELLRALGVSHPRLEAMIDSVAPAAVGAKLTGAGAGGSIVALPIPGRELETARRIAKVGGVSFVVRPAPVGTEIVH
jgi:mevalonate kinase